MAKQTVNIGAEPNDKTGDPLRVAFEKINSNFNEQYFESDIVPSLSGGRTFGKYANGQTIPAAGKTAMQVILDALSEYINPELSGLSVSSQATTVEVGTTISGTKSFSWTYKANSGNISQVDILQGATPIASGLPNSGSASVAITSTKLSTAGGSIQWRVRGVDANNNGETVTSAPFTVVARYRRFFGPAASQPASSADARGLPSSAFHSGAATFILNTGTTHKQFFVVLPPNVTIASVIDLDALNVDITSQYQLVGTIAVLDAGGTSHNYNLYKMAMGETYSSNHRHQITTAN